METTWALKRLTAHILGFASQTTFVAISAAITAEEQSQTVYAQCVAVSQ